MFLHEPGQSAVCRELFREANIHSAQKKVVTKPAFRDDRTPSLVLQEHQ